MTTRLACGLLAATLCAAPLAAAAPDSAPPHHDGMKELHAMMGVMLADKEMTRGEVSALVKAQFAARDTNKDGVLSGEELTSAHSLAMRRVGKDGEWKTVEGKTIELHQMEGMPHDMPMPDVKELRAIADPAKAFDRMDTNKDGMLSREEFAKGREIRIEKIVTRDGEGKPGKAHGMRLRHGLMGMMALHINKSADANKDGKVTLAEAEAAAMARFDARDADKDGKLVRGEGRDKRVMIRKVEKPAG